MVSVALARGAARGSSASRPRSDRGPAVGADRPARLLQRRQRVRVSRGVASECRSARSPTAEDRVLAIDMLRAGYAKAYVPTAAVLHSHRLQPDRRAAPLLRRVARPARGIRLARARNPATRAARAAREPRAGAARAGRSPPSPAPHRLAALGGRGVALRGASHGALCSARGPTGSRPRSGAGCRSSGGAGFAALEYDRPAEHSPSQEHAP